MTNSSKRAAGEPSTEPDIKDDQRMLALLLSLLVYCAIPGLNTGINIVGIIKQMDSNEERRQCDTWYCDFSFFFALTLIQMLPIVLIFCVLCGFVLSTLLTVITRGVLRCRLFLWRHGNVEKTEESTTEEMHEVLEGDASTEENEQESATAEVHEVLENDAEKGCCEQGPPENKSNEHAADSQEGASESLELKTEAAMKPPMSDKNEASARGAEAAGAEKDALAAAQQALADVATADVKGLAKPASDAAQAQVDKVKRCVWRVLSWFVYPVELVLLFLAFSVIALEKLASTVIFRTLGMERPKYEFHAGYVIMRSHQPDGAFYRNMSSSSAIAIDTLATEAVSRFMSLFFYRAIEDTTARINLMLYFGRLHDLKLDFAGVLSTVLTLAQLGTLRRDMMGHGLFKFILIIACLLKYIFALETNPPAIVVVFTMLPGYAQLGVSHRPPTWGIHRHD